MSVTLHQGCCIEVMRSLPDNSVDSIVTDPPYELGFMGKGWDKSGIANNVDVWKEALRVLKPGGHLLAFSGSRTYHRMTCAIEDAGFEVRDQIMWVYGSGFPKSLNVSKAIDKAFGATRQVIGSYKATGTARTMTGGNYGGGGNNTTERDRIYQTAPATDSAKQYDGWGTALKPAHEPVCVARKPLIGTVAANVLEHGTGGLNIDACRIGSDLMPRTRSIGGLKSANGSMSGANTFRESISPITGRWPANFIHDGSEEVVSLFPSSKSTGGRTVKRSCGHYVGGGGDNQVSYTNADPGYGDDGSAARFFYCPKSSKNDRGDKNTHPTVKPTDLMAYLVRLVTPYGGTVLDPFMGSGSTGKACMREGFNFIGIDLQPEYVDIARARIEAELLQPNVEVSPQPDLFAEA